MDESDELDLTELYRADPHSSDEPTLVRRSDAADPDDDLDELPRLRMTMTSSSGTTPHAQLRPTLVRHIMAARARANATQITKTLPAGVAPAAHKAHRQRRKRRRGVLKLLLAALAGSATATAAAWLYFERLEPHLQLRVELDPPDAELRVDGALVSPQGAEPLRLPCRGPVEAVASAPGFLTEHHTLPCGESVVLVLRLRPE